MTDHDDALRDLLDAFRSAPVDQETRAAMDEAQLRLDAGDAAAAAQAALAAGDDESIRDAAYRVAGVFHRMGRLSRPTSEEH
jgi:hypothetical protein